MEGFATNTVQDFVALAVELVKNSGQLAALRGRLQAVMAASRLCDPQGFTRGLEDSFRRMLDWRF